jgi:hypothetical protein
MNQTIALGQKDNIPIYKPKVPMADPVEKVLY